MFSLATKADTDAILKRLEEIAADHKLQQDALKEQVLERIRELEEAIEDRPKPDAKAEPKDEIVPGFVPHSARKRNWEARNRKQENKA